MHANTRRVVEAGEALGVAVDPREFPEGTRTAADAAAAIGCALGQIVKSLVFTVDGEAVIALVSGENQLDVTKLGAAIASTATARPADSAKVKRADADTVRAATGYPIGGVPPFGHATDLPVYVDAALLRYDVVWAAAGTPHTVFAVTPEALVSATRGTVADVASAG